MIKKLSCLIVILAISLSLMGCTGKKAKELTPSERSNLESLAKGAVSFEVFSKYGIEPGITVDTITAYDTKGDVYDRTDFTASGSYTVMDEAGDLYSGTFKVTGYIEGHGSYWDISEMTPPKNGTKVLPEQTGWFEIETDDVMDVVPQDETSDAGSYGPLYEFINENISETEIDVDDPSECDINKDGHLDLCTTVTVDGTASSVVVVYDVYNEKGYMLDGRPAYDYLIIGSTADDIAIERTECEGGRKSYGTLAIEGGELIFVEDEAYGATTPVG